MSLNDPQWGRGGGSNTSNDGGRDNDRKPQRPGNDGPPDLDELWRDFNRRLNNLFGRRGGGGTAGTGRQRPGEPKWRRHVYPIELIELGQLRRSICRRQPAIIHRCSSRHRCRNPASRVAIRSCRC